MRERLCYLCGAPLEEPVVGGWAKWSPDGCCPAHEQEILRLMFTSEETDPVLEEWCRREDALAEDPTWDVYLEGEEE